MRWTLDCFKERPLGGTVEALCKNAGIVKSGHSTQTGLFVISISIFVSYLKADAGVQKCIYLSSCTLERSSRLYAGVSALLGCTSGTPTHKGEQHANRSQKQSGSWAEATALKGSAFMEIVAEKPKRRVRWVRPASFSHTTAAIFFFA